MPLAPIQMFGRTTSPLTCAFFLEERTSASDSPLALAGRPSPRISGHRIHCVSQCAQQILTIVQDHEPPELRVALRFSRQTERPIHGAWVAVVVPVSPEVAGIGLGRLVLVDDCGHVIDPCWWTGRAGGGIAQAIGAALLEQIVVSAHVNCCRGVCSTMRFALVQRRWQSRCGWPPGGDCNAVVDALQDDSTLAGGRSPGNERLTPQTLEWRVTPGPSVKRGDTALFISCAVRY